MIREFYALNYKAGQVPFKYEYVKDESSDKLIKTVIIARSGIYKYRAEELPNLGLSFTDSTEKKDVYLIYRPALVLSTDKDKFRMLPLTNGHPENMVNSENFKDLAIGFTGDTIEEEWNAELDEVTLKTKVALVDNQALENYYVGVDEVSTGYIADFVWQKGTTSKGEVYDIVMTAVTNGNHLAMTPKARAGSVACIIDSEGGNMDLPKFMSNLWRIVRKTVSGVKDEDKQFRTVCEEIANKKDVMKDEEINGKIEELKKMSTDLPESDNKSILSRYLEDFGIVKQKDEESAKLAAGKIADMYEKLDSESQGEIMGKAKDEEGLEPDKVKDAGSPEENFIEGLESLFMKYHEEKGSKDDDDDDKAKDDEEEEKPKKDITDKKTKDKSAKDKAKDDDDDDKAKDDDDDKVKDDEEEEPKKEEKKSVGDSMGNMTFDSRTSGKEGLGDFFRNKIKGGKR